MEACKKALALAIQRREAGDMIAAFGPELVQDLRLYCIDAGNLFNPLPLVAWLRSQNVSVREILDSRVFLSRAFTCHQLVEAIDNLLHPLLAMPSSTIVVLVLGVEKMFLDGDIRLRERRYLFTQALKRITDYSERGLPILITYQGKQGFWFQELKHKVRMLPNIQRAIPAIKEISNGKNMANI